MSGAMTASVLRLPRPVAHFTPARNWMNDPNGLVFHGGRWHLFFQYNPEGVGWGNMSWGHASSDDLFRWREHPVALMHREGEQIFSGSAVALTGDRLVAYFTSAYDDGRQAQSAAVSTDGGETWVPDADNPLLDRGSRAFRDPKIIRYRDDIRGTRWIMVAVEAEERRVLFYASADLREWEQLSSFGPLGDDRDVVWECPDLFPLPLDGDQDDPRWVLTLSTNPVGDRADPDGSSMHYLVGRFDGVAFAPDADELRRLDAGRDFYAGVTFDSAPGGETIMLGWMSNWRYAESIPSTGWRGAMSLPRRLSLRTLGGVPRLIQEPPALVGRLLGDAEQLVVAASAASHEVALGAHAVLEARWRPSRAGALCIRLESALEAWVELRHDPVSGSLSVTRDGAVMRAVHPDFASAATVALDTDGEARLLLILDGPLLEVFVGGGEATVSDLVLFGDGDVTALVSAQHDDGIALRVSPLSVPERTA